jgi:carbamate kinase
MIVMLLWALAAAAVAVLVTAGYVMVLTVGCEEDRLHYIREAKRELDADRAEFLQKEAKEAKASGSLRPLLPSVKKSGRGGAEP